MSAKSIRVWYWITTVLFALFMLYSGIGSLIGSEAGDELMMTLGYPLYLNLILGVAKILGSVAILQTRYKTVKEWAYAGFTFDMVGAAISFMMVGMTLYALSVVLPLALMVASYILWKKSR